MTMGEGRGGVGMAGWMRRVRLAALLAVVVLVLIVLFQNTEPATFDVLFWRPQVPRALLVLGAFGAGAVAGMLALHLLGRGRD